MEQNLRNSGIDIIGDVPWGTHFCQLYQTKEDMMELLVPYFRAGLDANEFCIWITSRPSEVEEAKEALRKAISDIDLYLKNGQIEVIPCTQWDVNENIFDPELGIDEVFITGLVEKYYQALAKGYDGLRLVENICSQEKETWNDFTDYEQKLEGFIGKYKVTALCTHFLDRFDATEIIDVILNHRFALIKSEGEWELIENSRKKERVDEIKLLANIVESSEDAIITKSLVGIITSWNKGAEQIYGYSAKEVIGKPISILEPPTLVDETTELTELIKQDDRIHHYETLRLRKNGDIINVSLTISPILDASGNPIAALSITRDITESKKAKEKLQKTENLYRIVTEQTGQVIYDYNLNTDKCSWAGAIEEVTGFGPEEFQILGKYVWISRIYKLNDNRELKLKNLKLDKDGRYKEELRFKRKDGTFIFIENSGVCLKDAHGHPYEAIGVIKNITDIKSAIDTIEESEEKYRSFVQNFHGIIFQFDENFVPVFLGGAVEEITGYGEENFMSQIGWEKIIHPDDLPFVLKEEEKVRNFSSSGYINIEYCIKHRDGKSRWVNEIYQKIHRENGKPDLYQSTIYDVTERKETEKFLANIETARKKEIHHRIKNNLQVISSLLDLQAEKFQDKECIRDSEVLEAFGESQNRIISMSLIHEELYKGKGTYTLNFSEYIKKLTKNLFQTYSLNSKNVHLCMDLEEDSLFDMDISVPLGIIVNELVSNSLKYAFTADQEGEIQIQLCRERKNNETQKSLFSLTISDNGKGIPEDLNLENVESLGLQLVSILVDQLDGETKLKRDGGTEFRITFEVNEKS